MDKINTIIKDGLNEIENNTKNTICKKIDLVGPVIIEECKDFICDLFDGKYNILSLFKRKR